MRVVVDTNVVVSHDLTPAARAARVRLAWQARRFDLITSGPIPAEIERVLAYPHPRARHRMDRAEIARVIENVRDLAILIEPADEAHAVRDDPDDNTFVARALAGGADVIVSGDRHLLALGEYAGIPILAPATFLLLLPGQEEMSWSKRCLPAHGQ
jgi:putative PIN family toxin of toxin-antitoxin system